MLMNKSLHSHPLSDLRAEAVALVGAGPLARSVARILSIGGAEVRLYAQGRDVGDPVADDEGSVTHYEELSDAVREASMVFLAIPAGDLDALCQELAPYVLPDQIAIVASRGVTEGFRLPHEHLRAHTCIRKIGVLGGPVHSGEMEAGRRINAVIASRFPEVIDKVSALSEPAPVSFHPSADIVGVEIAGAISNVASVAAGLAEGLSLGKTAEGILLARGVAEGRSLGLRLGAREETFAGLAGLGELIPRAVRSMERHVELGRQLAQGTPLEAILESLDGHVEGILTAREASAKAQALSLDLPMVFAVGEILKGNVDPRTRLDAVLAQPLPLNHS